MNSPRERLVETALAGGVLSLADIDRARERREEYLTLGADVPVEDLLAEWGLLSRDDLEDATRGEEIPSRIAGMDVLRLAGGTPDYPVLLARRVEDGECVLAYACMLRRAEAPTDVDAFLRAAELSKRVTGSLWVPMREAAGADGAYVAVSEVPDGVRLDEVLERDGVFAPPHALRLLRTLAEALWPLEALGVGATFPDPSLVFRAKNGVTHLIPFEVLRAARQGMPDAAETARSAGRLLARLVGPEHVEDPIVRDALADLSRGRIDALRPVAATGRMPGPVAATGLLPEPRAAVAAPLQRAALPGSGAATRGVISKPAASSGRGIPKWAVVLGIVAVAGATVALVWPKSSAPERERPAETASTDEAHSSPPALNPARRGPDSQSAEPAWVAYEDALAFKSEHKDDWQAVVDRFRAVEQRYGGSKAAAEAQARRAEFTKGREAEGEAQAERIALRVEPMLATEDVGGALEEVRKFPATLRDTPAAKRVDALESRALAKADAYVAARREAIEAAGEPGFEEAAQAAVAQIRRLGVAALTKAAERRFADAKERGTASLSRRKDLEPDLVRTTGEALAAAGTDDLERARRVLDTAERGPLSDVFRSRLLAARESVERVTRVYVLAAGAAKSQSGKPLTIALREYRAAPFPVSVTDSGGDRLSYTRGGIPATVRLGAIDPEVLVRLALSEGREADAQTVLAAATLYAACGRTAQADVTLAAARALGAAEGFFGAEAQAVKVWLAAAASRDLAAADAILETNREGARAGYARAAVMAPFLPDPHRRLGEMLLADKKPDEAFAEFRRAQALGGSGADLLHWIAKSTAGRPDAEVLEAWRSFLRVAPPDDPRAEGARAEADKFGSRVLHGATEEKMRAAKGLLDAGKAAEALAALEEAVANDPASAAAHADLAKAAEKAGDMVRAYRAWRTAKALAKSVDEAGKARGQMDRLERTYGTRGTEEIVRKSADDALARGEASSGADLYRRAIGMSPLDPLARVGLGVALYTLMARTSTKTSLDEASAAFEAALAITPDDPEAHKNRADMRLYIAQDRGGAIEDATAALEKKKEYAEAYYTRGIAYYLSLQFEAALADITVVKTLRPLFAMPRISRAQILEALTRYDEADDELRGALECNPSDAEKAAVKVAKDRIAQRRRADRK